VGLNYGAVLDHLGIYLSMAFGKFGNYPGRIVAHSWQDYKSRNLIAEIRL
jgi:hypothetical protein